MDRSTKLAREFRREPTPTEERLWQRLRGRRLAGPKFRRQHPLGGCIADFYCAEAGLVVEADGGVHLDEDQVERDQIRDEHLRERGYTVLRFTNTEIDTELEWVTNAILSAAHARRPRTHSSPA